MKEKIKEKEEAIKLRKLGCSYKEIAKMLCISRGSCSLWLSSVEISDEAKQRLYTKQKTNWRTFSTRLSLDQNIKNKISKSLKGYYAGLPSDIKKQKCDFLLSTAMTASQLSFTIIEKKVKLTLEKIFNANFKKEKINNCIIDFANKQFVIEHTIDNGKGIRCALDRLNQVMDGRIKILICPSYGFGDRRRSEVINLYHWPLDLFDKGEVPEYIKSLSSHPLFS
jgi:predicted transcriptional regulator